MTNKNIVKDLRDLIDKVDVSLLPHQKGNCIRIGHVLVQERKFDYSVYDLKQKQEIAVLFCKTSAIALAKSLANGKNVLHRIVELDQIIEKNYIDCIFYKNTIAKSKDKDVKEIINIRYNIARKKTQNAKEKLDRFIF